MKKRITELIDEQGGNQSQFARSINLQPGHLSMLMTTDTGISASVLAQIANIGVNMHWMYTGKGEMFSSPGDGRTWEEKYHELQINNTDAQERLKLLKHYVERLEELLTKKVTPEQVET